MAAFPLPFLTAGFIEVAITDDDASFSAAIAQLKAQTHIPVNANSDLLFGTDSPITFSLYTRHNMQEERSALLIEALYTHCGIPTTPWVVKEEGQDIKMIKSPLFMAARSLNFPAFQTLLLKCKADFDANDSDRYFEHSILHVLSFKGDEAVKFLTLLPNNNPSLLNPNLNGNYNGDTALHKAVLHSDINPEVVRLLIQKFGADPSIRNRRGGLPLDTLNEMACNERLFRRRWGLGCTLAIFEEKVFETERLLTHTDRALAVLMGVGLPTRNEQSELRHLDKELAAMILALAA